MVVLGTERHQFRAFTRILWRRSPVRDNVNAYHSGLKCSVRLPSAGPRLLLNDPCPDRRHGRRHRTACRPRLISSRPLPTNTRTITAVSRKIVPASCWKSSLRYGQRPESIFPSLCARMQKNSGGTQSDKGNGTRFRVAGGTIPGHRFRPAPCVSIRPCPAIASCPCKTLACAPSSS